MLVLFYVRVRVWCTETETVTQTQTQTQTRVWVSIRVKVRVRVRLTGKERIGVASSTQRERASERACVRDEHTSDSKAKSFTSFSFSLNSKR